MKKSKIIITGQYILLFSVAVVFAQQDNRTQTASEKNPRYTIDNCVTEFTADSVIKTKAGWQFWFVDKEFANGYSLKMSNVEPNAATHPPHVHDEHEIFYILEGTAEFTLNDQKKIVHPNTSLYCPSGMSHGIRNAGQTVLKYLVIKQYQE